MFEKAPVLHWQETVHTGSETTFVAVTLPVVVRFDTVPLYVRVVVGLVLEADKVFVVSLACRLVDIVVFSTSVEVCSLTIVLLNMIAVSPFSDVCGTFSVVVGDDDEDVSIN